MCSAINIRLQNFQLTEIIYTSPKGHWSIAKGICAEDGLEKHLISCRRSSNDGGSDILMLEQSNLFYMPHEIYDLISTLQSNVLVDL